MKPIAACIAVTFLDPLPRFLVWMTEALQLDENQYIRPV